VNGVRAAVYHGLQSLGGTHAHVLMWTSLTSSAGLLAIATGFAVAAPVTVISDTVLRAGPGADFSAIGHVPGGTELETTDCAGGWCRVEFNGIVGFAGAADLGTDAAIRSSSARRAKNGIVLASRAGRLPPVRRCTPRRQVKTRTCSCFLPGCHRGQRYVAHAGRKGAGPREQRGGILRGQGPIGVAADLLAEMTATSWFCFAEPEDADAFAARFGGKRLPTGSRR
jgi:uncharacterized protein YraI